MRDPIFKKRGKLIVYLIDKELMTMTAVAKIFRISKQRVQQIYLQEKEGSENV